MKNLQLGLPWFKSIFPFQDPVHVDPKILLFFFEKFANQIPQVSSILNENWKHTEKYYVNKNFTDSTDSTDYKFYKHRYM